MFYIYIFFQVIFHHRLLQDIVYCSLCYAVCRVGEIPPICASWSFSVTAFVQRNEGNTDSLISEGFCRVSIHQSLPHQHSKFQPLLMHLPDSSTVSSRSEQGILGPHVLSLLHRRHMLLFTAYAPVGHSIHICSMVTFVVGDEDVVLPNFEPVKSSANVICLCMCVPYFQRFLNQAVFPFFYSTYPFFF